MLHEDGTERTRFTFPRQRRGRRLCLADFFRPEESGETDVVGLQVVTVGSRIGAETAKSCSRPTPTATTSSCTACPSSWPRRSPSTGTPGSAPSSASPARTPSDVEDMFALKYRGARFSLGYGACPDLEDRAKIAELLQPERIGVRLSEEFQLHPEQSTDAIVIHHPEAKYFNAR